MNSVPNSCITAQISGVRHGPIRLNNLWSLRPYDCTIYNMEEESLIISMAMVSLGASTLAPWLAYIAAADFFMGTYPDADLMFIFPVQNFTVLVVGGVFLMFYGEALSLNARILVPQFILIFAMLVVPLLNFLEVDQDIALKSTLFAQFIGAVCVTVYQSASYGAGGMLGPSVMNSLETGKGVGGVGIILARVITKAFLPDNAYGLKMSTNIFFLFSNGLVVLSIVLWFVLLSNPYAASKMAGYEAQRRAAIFAASLSPLPSSSKSSSLKNSSNIGKTSMKKDSNKMVHLEEGSKLLQKDPSTSTSFTHVLWAISSPATVVTVTFLVCLSCFPGLTTSLVSRNLQLGDWFPVLLVLIYNSGDLIGKSLPAYRLIFTLKSLPFASVLHLLFIPLFVFTAKKPSLDGSFGCFGTDQFAFLLAFCLGVCTGYISCSAMMLGPSCVEATDRVVAGQMMSTCLMFGLFAGSMLGLYLSTLV